MERIGAGAPPAGKSPGHSFRACHRPRLPTPRRTAPRFEFWFVASDRPGAHRFKMPGSTHAQRTAVVRCELILMRICLLAFAAHGWTVRRAWSCVRPAFTACQPHSACVLPDPLCQVLQRLPHTGACTWLLRTATLPRGCTLRMHNAKPHARPSLHLRR